MTFRSSLALAILTTFPAAAQTTTPPHKPSTHRTTSAASKTTTTKAAEPVTNPADNPPNVPKVEGTPKNLYALRYIDVEVGTGELAKARQYYTVHYTGWLPDGTKFDSSHDHPGNQPIVFPYGARQVIAGWDTGFEGMHVGGKRRLYIPYQLAYGESGRPPVIPEKANLIFDIELVAQSDTPPQAEAPTAPASEPHPSDSTSRPEGNSGTNTSKPATLPSESKPQN